ncbi:hypothetical protein DFH08DRAFT_1084672 [Mycena albidolilacea]|uniref:Uncharacterized protein n=1 Tax=Mycena albidolilacea TaxID=1033008 RepID=A0AAD6ZK53_9AGAR|nr:hypothetical protein DFH08DRAFT_1084672 [Mycena albidolilacea]
MQKTLLHKASELERDISGESIEAVIERVLEKRSSCHEQRLSLFLPFRSVKLEWGDFNGMRSVCRLHNSSCPASPPPSQAARPPYLHPQTLTWDPIRPPALPLPPHAYPSHSYSQPPPPPAAPEAFAVLTNAHLASFGKDNTICVRRPSYSSPPPHTPHTPLPSPWRLNGTRNPPRLQSVSSPPAPVRTSPTAGGKPRSSARGKWRSPVKGLFPFSLSSASSASATRTPCPIRVPLPPLVSVDGDAPEEDDEDAWVDEDEDGDDSEEGEDEDGEMTVIDDRNDRECGGDEELATPVPWRSDLLAPRTPPALSVNVHVGAPPAYYESEGEREEPQTPVPGLYSRETTPTPYTRGEEERQREGEQVGGKRKR